MVILDKINKYYYSGGEKIHVIDNVSAVLPDTGLVFILGPSGSGKSTLLNLLGGLDNPDSGDIWIENRKLSSFSKAEKIAYLNSYLGFVFQEYNILKDLSLKENITLALEIQKHSRKEINKRFKEIINAVELNGLEKRKVSQLSGGQKQRIAIARALIKHPKMIIADEPTGNLDSETSKNIFNLFKELSKERLIVIVSHDVESAQIYADQIIQMGMAEVRDEEIEDSSSQVEETKVSKKKVKEVSPLVLFKQTQRKDLDELELLRKNALNAKHFENEDVQIHSVIEERITLQNKLAKLQESTARLQKLSSSTLYFFNKTQEKIKEAKEKEIALKENIELAFRNNTDLIEEIYKARHDEILNRPKPTVDVVVKKVDYVEVLEKFGLDQSQEHNIKLTKAKIPTKTVVKLAIKNLWKKKFRYLVMLLVCAISLAFLSFTIELNGNPLRQNVFTMVENGYQYTEIKRYVPIEDTSTHDFYAKYNYGDLPANSYDIIKEGVPELTLHKYETVEIKYAGANIENKNYFYTGVVNTIIEYDKTNTYRLLCGTTPKEDSQEIMISDYLVSALQYFNLVPRYENYEEYLGMYLDLNWYENYKVVGIIDSNYEKWSKFYRLGTVDDSIKDNYSFINDFKMMNSIILTKPFFNEEIKNKGDYTRLFEETINFKLTDQSDNSNKFYNPVAINIMSTTVAQGTTLFTPSDRWSEPLPQSRMPQNASEIVLPIQVVEKMYNFTYSSSNWGSRRELYNVWKEHFINKPITLTITSSDGTKTYTQDYKVVGLTTESTNYIIHDTDLSNIKDMFLSRNENIMVELPSDPEKALDLFNKAYKLRDEEKGIPGYIINVWVYRSDIDSYEVDPFIEIISKGGLFVFTVFTIGIMWTIISIEIVDSRKEIGILRSIGLSGVKVSLIFILQTVTVNLLAYGLAVFLSSKFIPFYNSSITDVTGKIILYLYTLTYRTPVFLLIFVLVMTITCTILPLIKIMSQKIIDVINEREK